MTTNPCNSWTEQRLECTLEDDHDGPHIVHAPKVSDRFQLERDAWKSRDDKPLPEDAEIEAAFPTRSERHDLYGEAMRLVGARYSKGGLVALVNMLLHRNENLLAAVEQYTALRDASPPATPSGSAGDR